MNRKLLLLLCLFVFFETLGICQQDFSQSPWHLQADQIDPGNYAGVTIANGMIGMVSSPEPLKVKDVVLNGVFDTYGRGRVSNILKGFNFANMTLDVNGQRINGSNVSQLRQVLDMKNGELTTNFSFGEEVSVSYTLRALRHLPFTSMIDITIIAHKDVVVAPASEMVAPEILRDVKNHYSVIDRPHVKIPLMTSVASSPTGRHLIAASNSFIFGHGTEPELIHEEWDYNRHLVRFRKHLRAGESFTFSIVGSECSTEHYADPHNEAERLSIYAMLEGRDRLISRHRSAWEKLWESDIIIEGDLRSQKAVRSAIYHLYSFAREGTAYSLSPMGLSGLGYNGHVFWDTELWMYPALLMLRPEIARSLIDYRFDRLEAARQNAFAHGYDGAMFPWESDGEGQEATPVWALTGPFEHHITGCVGVAYWEYFRVTQDREWLEQWGYPMLKEVADFWVSRVECDAAGICHINNVVGADEWAENVDDNAFTNGVAISSLKYATRAAKVLEMEPNPLWEEIASRIPILKLPGGATREYRGYVDTTIKQADVNLLSYPLEIITEKKEVIKDLEFYEPRMSPTGPAMGFSVLSVLNSRLGNPDKAWDLFELGYQPNEMQPFGVLAECPGCSNPYFATGAGGMLQAVMAGFGGLEPTDEGIIQLRTRLPERWKSLTLTGIGPEKKTFRVEK